MCECYGEFLSENETLIEEQTCTYIISPEQEETCCKLTTTLESEGRLIICITGILFNTIAALLLLDKKLSKELFNRLLLCLVLMDNVYLLIGILEVWINNLESPTFRDLHFYFYFIYPFRGIVMCSIIYMTIIISFQRYISITSPLDIRMQNRSSRGATWLQVLKFVGPVILFSVIFQIPTFFEIATESELIADNKSFTNATSIAISEKIENYDTYDVVTRLVISDLRSHDMYVLIYQNFANIIVTGIIPLLLLAYFNFVICKGMRKFVEERSTRRKESHYKNNETDLQQEQENRNQRNQTIILFVIVVIYVLCHSLRIILNIVDVATHSTTFQDLNNDCRYGHPLWVLISHPISEALLKLNSSVNFFIYCAFNNCFRKTIRLRLFGIMSVCGMEQRFTVRSRPSSICSKTNATELTALNKENNQASLT